ncbi:MAG: FKBP-type peptidyl-prolyl cis-trans isomerase [Mediterranea sp.]|jgi:FKBP-type peptidyl-prolyl cis-trans isomerase FklB|nr:FKBP-type peptidyl-prolyl cis-trans isomerase [Mediterranea sp.]
MKKYLFPTLLIAAVVTFFAACEETTEVDEYANWQPRNEAYIDSLKALTGNTYVSSVEQVEAIPVGKLFAIPNPYVGTTNHNYYVYCKKISPDNPDGVRPYYTSAVSTYYYGTLINGNRFDGNFSGYGATDRGTLDANDANKAPTPYDTPSSFGVNTLLSGVSGWTAVLQYMRKGERWILYIPWQCAYGSAGKDDIRGYSTLVFDLKLDDVAL